MRPARYGSARAAQLAGNPTLLNTRRKRIESPTCSPLAALEQEVPKDLQVPVGLRQARDGFSGEIKTCVWGCGLMS